MFPTLFNTFSAFDSFDIALFYRYKHKALQPTNSIAFNISVEAKVKNSMKFNIKKDFQVIKLHVLRKKIGINGQLCYKFLKGAETTLNLLINEMIKESLYEDINRV